VPGLAVDSEQLDRWLAEPSAQVSQALERCPGDIAVLGAGGKLGFHLTRMLQNACQDLHDERKIVAVSRFGNPVSREKFAAANIETVSVDLSQADDVAGLSKVPNVFYLAGVKFGTSADADLLHRINVEAPRLVARHFQRSRIVALSTGCVYSFTTPESGGSTEASATEPPGHYAQSCLGREAAFVDAASEHQTRSALVRLNYANEPRYGVLVDIGQKVLSGQPINVEMGYVNVIWQRDAVDHIIQCLPHTAAPPFVINVTGGEVVRVREIAEQFASQFGCDVQIEGQEAPTAWLSNASRSHALFGPPATTLAQMIASIAGWLKEGRETLGKPTHFETRDGQY
jgi:nucleoside-diphosphate-sugar epimerase